jgi:alpha 1,3-mannosyltransferase
MDKFLPRQAPLKEGRAHPFQYPLSSRRRSLSTRSIAAIVAAALACIFLVYYLASYDNVSNATSVKKAFGNAKSVAPIVNSVVGSDDDSSSPGIQAPKQQPAIAPIHPDPQFVPDLKSEHSEESTILASAKTPKRPDFQAVLDRVLSLLPDEMHQRELLRPFDGTGKEKLREIGLRSRAYKGFFEAWENLHLVIGEDSTYVRDDVLQYLRSQNDASDSSAASLNQIMRNYESYRWFLSRLSTLLFPWTSPYFADHMDLHSSFHRGGRGIALTAGDEQAPYLLASIPSFRKLGCNLPIEIMYLGDSDLSEDFRTDLEALEGVYTRDLSQMVNDEGWKLAGWAGKPFTILFSSFREVIFIDADSLFFHNPAILFEDPEYQRTGALFFRDRLIMPESKKRWLQAILPKPISKQVRQSRMWTGDSGHQQESGVIVVDKWKHFVALLLVSRMNGPDRDGNKDEGKIGIYDMVYGKI